MLRTTDRLLALFTIFLALIISSTVYSENDSPYVWEAVAVSMVLLTGLGFWLLHLLKAYWKRHDIISEEAKQGFLRAHRFLPRNIIIFFAALLLIDIAFFLLFGASAQAIGRLSVRITINGVVVLLFNYVGRKLAKRDFKSIHSR